MNLGAFSVSLNVKDLGKSKDFYEKLGFEVVGGEASQNWLIMRNGDHTIGLFQGMFDTNILTFNPGWDQQTNTLESFTDVREIRNELKSRGVNILNESIENESGPASLVIMDPDGNPILIDQHV